MSISFELPVVVEEQLRRDQADLDVVAEQITILRQLLISQTNVDLTP